MTTDDSSYDALEQLCKSKKPASARVASILIRMPKVRDVILLKETNEYNRLIKDAVDALMEERVEEARKHLVQAKARVSQFRVFKIETDLVLDVEKICAIRPKVLKDSNAIPGDMKTRKVFANALLSTARIKLKNGQIDVARAYALTARYLNVSYTLFDDRPELILAEIERSKTRNSADRN